MSDLEQYDGDGEGGDEGGDGFDGPLSPARTIKGTQLVWNDSQHWRDRDGQKAPAQLLVVAIDAILQRWKDNKPQVIRIKPLPDPFDLNSAIPIEEWEAGVDGKPRPPWADTVVVYFVDPIKGGFFTFVSSTTGASIAVDHLKESVASMRMLRGGRVLPLIELGERPMKTKFGVKSRPHFEVIDWKDAGVPLLKDAPKAVLPPASKAEPGQAATPQKPTALERMAGVKPISAAEAIGDDGVPY